ncbi:MAG: isocitrate lyase/phosphoenolpyruvate mutase family protein [Actinomycetota bacterium]
MTIDHATAAARAHRFQQLHETGTFVMANVADAGTAAAVADVGIEAIATTSSGHAATIGRQDAAGDVSMEEHAEHTEALVEAVAVPCNVDAENGYGHEPEDMAVAVERFAAAGAAGMGIEDWSGDPQIGLYDTGKAIARIEAAVDAANRLDRPFVITGRTEILLYGLDGGLPETITRLQGMAAAGAHCLYAPGTWDLETIRTVVAEAGGPVNVLLPLGRPAFIPASSPSLGYDELADAGVRRISIGGSLYSAQVNIAADLMRRALSGGVFATPVIAGP